jgi:hypothetical protein
MPARLARTALSLIALAATCSLVLGSTVSAYSAASTTAVNTFTAATDWAPPVATAAAIGRTTAYGTGFIKQGGSYYVYAEVSDTGNPASGTASVTANVDTITSAHPAVVLTAGSYDAGGVVYNRRTAILTAGSSLNPGSYTYTLTSTDNAANSATQSFTVVIDNTAPTATDVQSTNVSGGTVGHFDAGDTLKLSYSSSIDPYSILSGWDGTTTPVQVALIDGGTSAPDYIEVYTAGSSPTSLTQVPVGVIYLGAKDYLTTGTGNYVSYGATGAASLSTMTMSGANVTITLGTPGDNSSSTSTTHAAMTWTPSTTATDIAGNAVTATTVTQTGALHVNF